MSKIEILKKAKEMVDEIVAERKANESDTNSEADALQLATMLSGFSEVSDAIETSRFTKEDLIEALSQIKIDVPKAEVTVTVPEIRLPTINVPEIVLPPFPEIPTPQVTVNVPEIKLPSGEFEKIRKLLETIVEELKKPCQITLQLK